MTRTNKTGQRIVAAAMNYLGAEEIPGKLHNAVIVDMFRKSGNAGIKDDETAWCAAFLGAVLFDVNIPGTKKLLARSYLNWGQPTLLREAQPGDVMIFPRGKSWQGHVTIFLRWVDANTAECIGGNQSDAVNVQRYKVANILGVRRAIPTKPEPFNWADFFARLFAKRS
jgi:uncharacterized protein (TIGR02594 family)